MAGTKNKLYVRTERDRARDKARLQSLRLKPGETRDCYGHFTIRSMREVADILGVSHQAVQMVERSAFLKIRSAFASMRLEGKL